MEKKIGVKKQSHNTSVRSDNEWIRKRKRKKEKEKKKKLTECQWVGEVRKGAKQSEWARGTKPKPQLTYLHCPSELKTTYLEWPIDETGKTPATGHVIGLRLRRKIDWSQVATVVIEWMNSVGKWKVEWKNIVSTRVSEVRYRMKTEQKKKKKLCCVVWCVSKLLSLKR